MLPGCSFTTAVCQEPIAVGFSQASTVIPVVRSRVAESGTETQAFVNESALLNLPPVTHVALESVPLFPLPDWSATVVPLPSSNAHAPTRPGEPVFETVTD